MVFNYSCTELLIDKQELRVEHRNEKLLLYDKYFRCCLTINFDNSDVVERLMPNCTDKDVRGISIVRKGLRNI